MTASATEVLSEGKEGPASRPLLGTRNLRASQPGTREAQRFLLAKPGESGEVPELGKDVPGEPEAMVESFKTGLSCFIVSEWREVADFSGKKSQLGREAAPSAPKAG